MHAMQVKMFEMSVRKSGKFEFKPISYLINNGFSLKTIIFPFFKEETV
jgi:hypothetical protein